MSFLGEVPSQALAAWVWFTIGCCILQIDPKAKCSVSRALCYFCGGAAGHQAPGNAVLQELPAHYYLHHRVSHLHQPSYPHSCGFWKPHMTSLILLQPTADERAGKGGKRSQRSYICRKEAEFSWKRYWTCILWEFVSDTSSFDIIPWSPKLGWTDYRCLWGHARPHPRYHIFTYSVHKKQCLVDSEKIRNLVLVCSQISLQAQRCAVDHPVGSPVLPSLIFWYHAFIVGPHAEEIILL